MKRMAGSHRGTIAIFAALALWLGSIAPLISTAATPAQSSVSVTYVNPQQFTENRLYGWQDRFNRVDYLAQLKAYLIKQGQAILKPGQSLHVNITDIRLAGAYEPWRGPQWSYVRIMRDIYSPRIDLNFKLIDQDGNVLREGKRVLRDPGYLSSGESLPGATGASLYYDKALLRRWLMRGPDKL
ncbi:MAG: DUF3016 domain-containing protein [Rhodanobacteraceae bacterium]|nr:MAG: DUF3016 domain-containing protein [Rhodanobacteraceae bacterium]